MEGHSGQKCDLIAPCIPLDRTFFPFDRTSIALDRTFLPFDRTSIPFDRTFHPFDRTFIPLDRAFVPFDHTSIICRLLYYIGLFLCGISHLTVPPWKQHPSDRNYRSAVVTIWSAVKRGRLNLDLMFVWRHTTYDYMTYY